MWLYYNQCTGNETNAQRDLILESHTIYKWDKNENSASPAPYTNLTRFGLLNFNISPYY